MNLYRSELRLALITILVLALVTGGYVSAEKLAADEGETAYITQRVITVVRKNRPPQVITTTLPVKTVPGETVTRVVTVRRNGRNILVRIPGPTVTTSRVVRQPGKRVVVTRTQTQKQTSTVVRDRVVTRPGVTVSLPGSTVTTPGATETVVRQTPGPVVTETAIRELPAPTVTEVQTVTQTVTLPQQTVTETQTVTEQETVTVTVTEPAPSP